MRSVHLIYKETTSNIYSGKNLIPTIQDYLSTLDCKNIFVVKDRNVNIELHVGSKNVIVYEVEGSEKLKRLREIELAANVMANKEIRRQDLLVAIGGGTVTDFAGFLASVYSRSISYINVATTLLAQVDAAIGGKTGVNLDAGKNLIGTVFQPMAVFCDINFLSTLPEEELRSGMGEIAKYELIGAGELDPNDLETTIYKCIKFKAGIVERDPFETEGIRSILNYGHTVGHAIEAYCYNYLPDLGISHGEAVAIGLVVEARISNALGLLEHEKYVRQLKINEKFGLDTQFKGGLGSINIKQLVEFMKRDKKATDALNFALVTDSGPRLVRVDVGFIEKVLSEFL